MSTLQGQKLLLLLFPEGLYPSSIDSTCTTNCFRGGGLAIACRLQRDYYQVSALAYTGLIIVSVPLLEKHCDVVYPTLVLLKLGSLKLKENLFPECLPSESLWQESRYWLSSSFTIDRLQDLIKCGHCCYGIYNQSTGRGAHPALLS